MSTKEAPADIVGRFERIVRAAWTVNNPPDQADIEAVRAALSERAAPVAWMWQHDETGRIGFVDVWQVENGWQANNPRCRLARPLYTHPAPERAAPTDFQLEQLFDAAHEHGEFGRGFRERARQILAAQPAAAVPAQVLTDDQIDADWREACRMHDLTQNMVRAFARTVVSRAALTAQPVESVPAQVVGKYADVLGPFVALMERELHANSAKGDRPGWLTMSKEVGLLEIYWHTAKLSVAVKNNDAPRIEEHAADVANMAMMLLDVCGGLAALTPQPAAAPESAERQGGPNVGAKLETTAPAKN